MHGVPDALYRHCMMLRVTFSTDLRDICTNINWYKYAQFNVARLIYHVNGTRANVVEISTGMYRDTLRKLTRLLRNL